MRAIVAYVWIFVNEVLYDGSGLVCVRVDRFFLALLVPATREPLN